MVLKDGQIIEQGSHKELLAQDGVFATMWADQISANGDPAVSIGDRSVKKESIAGYLEDEDEPTPVPESDAPAKNDTVEEQETSESHADIPEATPAAPESSEAAVEAPPVPSKESADVASDEPAKPSAPLAFPTSDDAASQTASQAASPERFPSEAAGGVTFQDSSPPSRNSTPDPEAEPKRKRISSQNLSKFARKMSLATRRTGSGSASSAQPPQDVAGGESSAGNSGDSPNLSVQSDIGKSKVKKDKKDKRKSIF